MPPYQAFAAPTLERSCAFASVLASVIDSIRRGGKSKISTLRH